LVLTKKYITKVTVTIFVTIWGLGKFYTQMLVNKRHDLKILLHSLNEILDIIAITEFKPKKLNHELLISEFNLDGYNVFCHGLENKGRRGVLFYIASDIQVTILDSPSAFQECIFLLLKGRGTSLSRNQLLLGNIYRSPNSTQDNDNELYKMLSYIQQHYNVPKLIVGDFNFQ